MQIDSDCQYVHTLPLGTGRKKEGVGGVEVEVGSGVELGKRGRGARQQTQANPGRPSHTEGTPSGSPMYAEARLQGNRPLDLTQNITHGVRPKTTLKINVVTASDAPRTHAQDPPRRKAKIPQGH